MLQLELVLEFCCCQCERPLEVTIRCEGEGLAEQDAKAMFPLYCPHCNEKNHVIFTPQDGQVVDVSSELEVVRWMIPEPSLN